MRTISGINRSVSLIAATAATLAVSGTAYAQKIAKLDLVGQATFDANALKVSTHTNGANTTSTVGGLSGITYDAARGVYYAISDDRGNLARTGENIDPRFYTLSLNLSRTNAQSKPVFGNSDVSFQSYTTLLNANGTPYAFQNTVTNAADAPDVDIDPEDIVLGKDGNSVYVCSEGDKARSSTGIVVPDFINRYALNTGTLVDGLTVPTGYQITPATDTTSGPRNNLAFESLTIDGSRLLTGVENPLQQDGPANSASPSGPVRTRLLSYDLNTSQANGEFFYDLDPIVETPTGANFATAGLCDLLAVGDGNYIALERSFTVGGLLGGGLKGDGTTAPATGYAVRLYQFSLNGVVSGGTVQKSLLLDLGTLGIGLDNLEGIELGQTLADGRRSLIVVSDDNFTTTAGNGAGSPGQFTQFVVLAVTSAPEPGALGLVIGAMLPVAGLVVRRTRRSR